MVTETKAKPQYYISHMSGEGVAEFTPVQGSKVAVPGYESFDLFIHRPVGDIDRQTKEPIYSTGGWNISDGSTGMGVVFRAGTRQAAIQEAKERLDKVGGAHVFEKQVAKYPKTPRARTGRPTYADGRLVPQVGDKVYQVVRGAFGTPASIEGVINKRGRVEVTGSRSSLLGAGGGPKAGKTYPNDGNWTVDGDPEVKRRSEEKRVKDAEQERRWKEEAEAPYKAEREAHAKAVREGAKAATSENVKVGDTVVIYWGGRPERRVVTEMDKDKGWVFARPESDPDQGGGSINVELATLVKTEKREQNTDFNQLKTYYAQSGNLSGLYLEEISQLGQYGSPSKKREWTEKYERAEAKLQKRYVHLKDTQLTADQKQELQQISNEAAQRGRKALERTRRILTRDEYNAKLKEWSEVEKSEGKDSPRVKRLHDELEASLDESALQFKQRQAQEGRKGLDAIAGDPRSAHAEAVDRGITAKVVVRDVSAWSKKRNRIDLNGVDTKRAVTIRTVPEKERAPKEKPQFRINRKSSGSGRGMDLGADIVRDRRGRHLRL